MNRPRRFRAGLLAAIAAMGVAPVANTPPAVSTVQAQTQQSDKQGAPAVTPAAQKDLQILADAGVPFYGGASGCPWPGRPAAWARRSSGVWRSR